MELELSADTVERQKELAHCLELKRRLEARQGELALERPAREAANNERRLALIEEGRWTETTRQQARVESGLAAVEEEMQALGEARRNFPALLQQKTEAAARSAQKDKERALEGLQKRLRGVMRAGVLPQIRALEKVRAEVEEICVQAAAWSQSGRAPGYCGFSFPAHANLLGVIRYALLALEPETEETRQVVALTPGLGV